MALKHKGTEAAAVDQERKKRKRVGFVATDAGIEPNDCIKIFAVLAGYNVPFGEGALHARRGGDE